LKQKIWLSSPHMGGEEIMYIQEAFSKNWIAPLGPNVNGFEEDLRTFLNINAVAALNSGTGALHLGLVQLGVTAGDYVFCQTMTFSASANPIKYLGANPVFIDSEKETWNICPIALEEAITDLLSREIPKEKLKAIIPVHLYGMPAKVQELSAISEKYGIPILEDAAESIGSTFNGKKCGTFGEMGVLSFNGNKLITTSGGGALVSKDVEKISHTRFLATQAKDDAPHYEHSHIGYNYRMSNVVAGIGRGQMKVLEERVRQRRENYNRYFRRYGKVAGLEFQPEKYGSFSNRWLTCLTIDPTVTGYTREDVRLALDSENIESRPLWKPMHMQPIFQDELYFGGKVAEDLFENGLCLPSGSNLTEEDFDRIFENLDRMFLRDYQ
jgi:dTDP-4-amino-4,6-dideoxygalactose transaminase